MDVHELQAALEARGLTVRSTPDGRLKVSRPGVPLAEEVHVEDDRAVWSWGRPVVGDDPAAVAALIDHVVSAAPEKVTNSA